MALVRLLGVAVAVAAFGVSVSSAQTSVPTIDDAALLIEYTGPTQLSNDFMVMRIRILNRTGRSGSWLFEFNAPRVSYEGGGRRSQFELEVEDLGDREFEILVPLAGASDPSWVQMFVYGDGVANAGQMEIVANTLNATVATSADATMDDEEARVALLGDYGAGEPLAFHMGSLSRDARAYASLSALWVTAEEWSGAEPAIRRVLTEWVAGGGRLVLLEPGDRPGASPVRRHGMGAIAKVPAGLTLADVTAFDSVITPPAGGEDSSSWAGSLIEPIETHKGFLSLVLLSYLVLAGPVNLFVFSRGAKRMRLFWTMPSIALGASAVMAVVIVLQDGVGGTGVRASFVYLQPELKRELVVQEQVSRTGALLRRGFEIAEPIQITSLATSSQSYPGSPDHARLASFGQRYEGDWFRSRSVQAQRLQTTRASRARVELVNTEGNRPSLLSSIDVPLDQLYFRDDEGLVWRAVNVLPGRPAVLGSATEQDYEQFWREVSFRTAGPRIRRHTAAIHSLRGTFLAKAAPGGSDATIETLSSIDWRESSVLYAGHIDKGKRGSP